jgi:nitrite reductase (NADH) large subunit
MAMRERLLIIGNGMASVRLCEELVTRCADRFTITVVGAEPRAAYNRVLLSSHLAGEADEADIALRDVNWYAANRIDLVTGVRVVSVDLAAGSAVLADGRVLAFDRVVFATGSDPIRLPLPGADLPGAMTFRDLDDVAAMRAASGDGRRAVVIGGGLLGLEAAWGLKRMGMEVTVVHLMDRLMERQLDPRGAQFLRKALERKGLRFALNADSDAIVGDLRVTALRLKDGRMLPADLVVMAVGIRPNVALARAAGIDCGRGVRVDDAMVAAGKAHALGECAEHRGVVYGLVEPAYQQAAVLARNLAGETASYGGTMLATNLKVSGVSVFSAGDFAGEPGDRIATIEDASRGLYRKVVLRGSHLAGAIIVGDTADAIWYRDLIASGADVSACCDDIIFGRDHCAPAFAEAA